MGIEKAIQQVAKGDQRAFEKLYQQLSKMVFAVALSVVRRREDAEDVLSETFVCVWRRASEFRGGSGKSWVCTIARNLSLNLVKKRNREKPTELIEELSPSYGIEGNVENRIILETALSVLDDKERETVLLYNNGLKHREIAEIMGEKLGTVTWRYQNALNKMRNYLGG